MSEDERKSSNIIISEPFPKGKPIIQFPIIEKNSQITLKKHLNIKIWNKIKYQKTNFGGGVHDIVKPKDSAGIGVLLTDSDV